MEKGNEIGTPGGAAVDTPPETPDDGAIVDPGPASTSGGGPSGTITNPDGSTTEVSRDEDGARITTTRDKDGNVTKTNTITRNEDGTVTQTTTDGDGNATYSERYGDWAESTNTDGSTTMRTTYGDGTEVVNFDEDGNETGGKWTSPDGTNTEEWNRDGSGKSTSLDDSGGPKSRSWEADGTNTREYTEPDIITGERVPVTETYKDGVTTKSYTDSQGSTVRTEARDGSVTYESTALDGTKSVETYAPGELPG